MTFYLPVFDEKSYKVFMDPECLGVTTIYHKACARSETAPVIDCEAKYISQIGILHNSLKVVYTFHPGLGWAPPAAGLNPTQDELPNVLTEK